MPEINLQIPEAYQDLFRPFRYKVYWGGRGAGRSWSFARALLAHAASRKTRVLCARELQSSIKESVHRLLSDQISLLGLGHLYTIQKDSIVSKVGSEFYFKGLRYNISEIKSMESIDVAWIEEANALSEESWQILIPTIRKEGSEIWLSFNTGEVSDPTYRRFVLDPPEDCVSKKVYYYDNPFFPSTLEKERIYLKKVDPEAYSWVWDGEPLHISDACVFRNKFIVESFETPDDARFYFGADWGFSQSPSTLVRSFVRDQDLFVDYEAYGVGVELDEIPQLFSSVPGYLEWIIYADNSRPETISYLGRKHNLRIEPCIKGADSIKDGIAFLRKFDKIYIHPRCKRTAEEFKLYAYKQDSKTGEILPIILDKNNHCIDALRYSLTLLIKGGIDWEAFLGEN